MVRPLNASSSSRIAGITYLFVRGFSRVMFLYQGLGGFNLDEKLHYELILGDSTRRRAWVVDFTLVNSAPLFPGSSVCGSSDDCQVDDGVDACESGDG